MSAPTLKRTVWRGCRRALHSTATLVTATGSAARTPKRDAAVRHPTALTESTAVPSSASIASACPTPTSTSTISRPSRSRDVRPAASARTPALKPIAVTRATMKVRRRPRRRNRGPCSACGRGCGSVSTTARASCGGAAVGAWGLARRQGGQPGCSRPRPEHRLGRRADRPVAALELRAVDGEIGLVDELVCVGSVHRIARDSDRNRRVNRLARGLDLEAALGDCAPDPLGDLQRLHRAASRGEGSRTLRRRSGRARRSVGARRGTRPQSLSAPRPLRGARRRC